MAVLSRRAVLAGLSGAGIAGGVALPAAASADAAKTITVACWGGSYADALRDTADARVRHDLGLAVTQRVAPEQARVASVAAGADVPDVALLSGLDAYRLSLRQLFLPVTTDKVASLPRIGPGLRIPYGVPQARTALTILYDKRRVDREPGSFAALFQAATRGGVGFSSTLALYNFAAAAIAQHGHIASLQSAKATFESLKRAGRLRIYPDNDSLGRALLAGEISMAPMWRARAYQWRQQAPQLRDVVAAEGAVPFEIIATVLKASRAPDQAMSYLDALLQPSVQVAMARRTGLLPTVPGAAPDRALLREIGFTAEQERRFRPLSLRAVAEEGVQLRQFWDQHLA